jgi:hypothetical protein
MTHDVAFEGKADMTSAFDPKLTWADLALHP